MITAEYDPLRDQGVAYAAALAGRGHAVRRAHATTACSTGSSSMVDWIDAGKVAFDDAVAALDAGFGRA